MSFSAEWLALREPHDTAARAPSICDAVLEWVDHGRASSVVDLGAGTGSTLRYLGPRLEARLPWTLVDIDADNLARVRRDTSSSAVSIQTLDLSSELPALSPRALVTASAFFDLVSEPWIEDFTTWLTSSQAALYSTLTVDGRHVISPPHPLDPWIFSAFRRHQTEVDKGFGQPAGPFAHEMLVEKLTRNGFSIVEAASDWELIAPEILCALMEGVAAAVEEITGDRDQAQTWLGSQTSLARAGELRMRVGHRDLFATPPA